MILPNTQRILKPLAGTQSVVHLQNTGKWVTVVGLVSEHEDGSKSYNVKDEEGRVFLVAESELATKSWPEDYTVAELRASGHAVLISTPVLSKTP